MTIQDALNTATEGGYHIDGSDGMETYYEGASNEYSAWTRTDNESTFVVAVEATFLDPLFWRALGLALGWHEGVATQCLIYEQWWREPWHRFIDHLADGNPPEAFFARLPCPAHTEPQRQHV